jgi:hypothetical protein
VPDRLTPAIDSVQTILRSNVHSQKPDEFYRIIERLYDGPYLELFARRARAGWTSFGNELLDEDVPPRAQASGTRSSLEGFGVPPEDLMEEIIVAGPSR